MIVGVDHDDERTGVGGGYAMNKHFLLSGGGEAAGRAPVPSLSMGSGIGVVDESPRMRTTATHAPGGAP